MLRGSCSPEQSSLKRLIILVMSVVQSIRNDLTLQQVSVLYLFLLGVGGWVVGVGGGWWGWGGVVGVGGGGGGGWGGGGGGGGGGIWQMAHFCSSRG